MDAKTIIKILEQVDPKENANCLGILLLLKPILSKAFDMRTYYDANGLVCELSAKTVSGGHNYKLYIRPDNKGDT